MLHCKAKQSSLNLVHFNINCYLQITEKTTLLPQVMNPIFRSEDIMFKSQKMQTASSININKKAQPLMDWAFFMRKNNFAFLSLLQAY